MKTGPKVKPIEDRFWKYVNKTDGCWLWMGTILHSGYGQIKIEGKKQLAHRVSWQLVNGEAKNLLVLHKCDVRNCVNPSHLFLGTYADNNKDAREKGRARGANSGEAHHNARLTNFHVRNIRFLRSIGIKTETLAKVYGVTHQHISKISNNQRRVK